MPVKDVYTFSQFLSTPVFCFNKAMNRLAISPNNNEIHIFSLSSKQWKLDTTLTEHSERVMQISWAPESNLILSCAADRNAYVWNEDTTTKEWKQSLVILRIDRAAINCSWAPFELKFAVGTGSKLICICHHEKANNWWVSKHIKKPIRSSVLCLDWHPQGTILASGSSDFRVRIYSAAFKGVEKKPEPTSWGNNPNFGSLLAEFTSSNTGWVHSVSFSPNGNKLVWVSHDCTVNVADSSDPNNIITYNHKISTLPLQACVFLDDSSIIAGGHDNTLFKFTWDGKSITECGEVDEGDSKKSSNQNLEQSAMSKFRNMDTFAQKGSVESLSNKKTHSNSIVHIAKLPNKLLATSSLDNKIVTWHNL